MEAWQEMLMQAYEMRALVVLLDGVDEAAGLRDQIDEFVHKEVAPPPPHPRTPAKPPHPPCSPFSRDLTRGVT